MITREGVPKSFLIIQGTDQLRFHLKTEVILLQSSTSAMQRSFKKSANKEDGSLCKAWPIGYNNLRVSFGLRSNSKEKAEIEMLLKQAALSFHLSASCFFLAISTVISHFFILMQLFQLIQKFRSLHQVTAAQHGLFCFNVCLMSRHLTVCRCIEIFQTPSLVTVYVIYEITTCWKLTDQFF